MRNDSLSVLPDRGVVAVAGPDAVTFLDNLVTSDLAAIREGEARLAALLTPQGKILFEMLALRWGEGWLLDTDRARASDLVKRLTMYKLRAKVTIADRSDAFTVFAAGPEDMGDSQFPPGTISFTDPRHVALGRRLLVPADRADELDAARVGRERYVARRVALGVGEAGADYPHGDTFPHEANYDRNGGVSFTKGCFVGQEVVARMQHKTVVRKRVVRVSARAPLVTGAEVRIGEATIGTIGSVDRDRALALVRLDRVVEALDKGQPLTAGGVAITVDGEEVERFRTALAGKATPA